MPTKELAIFASGTGSNAVQLIHFFKDKPVTLSVYSNKKDAPVLEKAKALGVATHTFTRKEFYETGALLALLKEANTDWVALAGFLWKVPVDFLSHFESRIVNLHPSLLPKYGGKGMYGTRVHEAVLAAGEKVSGITIHRVNAHYDEGEILRQVQVPVLPNDTPKSLAQRIHAAEHAHFPLVVGELVLGE
jgi:phosphoribosylglycinamide formyltransferase-1